MASELGLGGAAGLRALADAGLWLGLLRTALSPLVLLQGVVAFVCLLVMAVLAAGVLPAWLPWLVPFGFALWLGPPVLRWFIGTVARSAVRGVAEAAGLAPQELPPAAAWRAWWQPALACALVLALPALLGIGNPLPVLVALFAALVGVATPAVVRSVLVPWFPLDRVDAALRSDRPRWAVLVAFWIVAWAALQCLLMEVAGLGAHDLVAGARAAWRNGHMLSFSAGHLLAPAAMTAAVGIFCTAALARMAAQRLLAEPRVPAEAGWADRFEQLRDSARRRAGSTRTMAIAVAAVLAVALVWPQVRKDVVLSLLHMDRDDVQDQRTQFACDGRSFRLRLLHWGGIDSTGGDRAMALACAARNGHLGTVKLLAGLGDSISAPVFDTRFGPLVTRMGPIAQALQSEKGLPSADYLLAQGDARALLRGDGIGPDAVQAAALSHCMACVEWAVRHQADPAGTWQSSPLVLWLDSAGRGSHENVNLQRLAILGLSAQAVGEDGRSALHAAANNGDLDAVDWLLAQGVDPARADSDGYTPLLYAASRLGTGTNGRPTTQDDPSDRERVRVVRRLLAVTPSVERGAPHPVAHRRLAPGWPFLDTPVDYANATRQYPALQEPTGSSLADLIDPAASP
jgi:hypothetical protein